MSQEDAAVVEPLQTPVLADDLLAKLREFWGYDTFRPLQQEAMQAVLEQRDSLVVMPTGGGKSLCYQVPALCRPGLAVIISPLISLMKDQVDTLLACGIQAACLNSSISASERTQVAESARDGSLKLLYLAPERLMSGHTLDFLAGIELSLIAVDEAHCISEWGHDFRPEYRELRRLKEHFPGVALHAYTATATEPVREDIARQLALKDPQILVGSFDRPNLNYRVIRRADRQAQIQEVLDRFPGESGIVYCIRRADVDEVAAGLKQHGYRALPYHAGLTDDQRRKHQEAFIQEKVDTIVATVAFGMGIDKSNVRYVVHAGMPKSLENYQQESGRAGRDGLSAECTLLYSGSDTRLWKSMLGDLPRDAYDAATDSLTAMEKFCTAAVCRHRTIVEYFGQPFGSSGCNACDVCCDKLDLMPEPLPLAQKILSCVVRLEQRYGADYTAKVLCGSNDKRILEQGHDRLSTYGLLSDHGSSATRDWIEQLVGQEYLKKSDEYAVLSVTATGWQVLKGHATPRLTQPQVARGKTRKTSSTKAKSAADWEGVDRGLFEKLRELRRELAEAKSIPAFVVFGDVSLREMARDRPTTPDRFRTIKGVGDKKCTEYAETFLACIAEYCRENSISTDV